MYESIRGILIRKEAAFAVIEAGGIGYRAAIPLSTYERLPLAGEEVTLLAHLVVREDEWRLFGFGTEAEREGFKALLRVSGVGPVLAVAVLSGMPPRALNEAVTQGDVRALTRVKGVGKKTAERILVELGDVWRRAPLTSERSGALPVHAEALRALEALGHTPEEARTRIERAVAAQGPDLDVTDLVRAALQG